MRQLAGMGRWEGLMFQVLDTVRFTDLSYLYKISRIVLLKYICTCRTHRTIRVSVYTCQDLPRPASPSLCCYSKVIFRLNDENEMMTQIHITVYLSQYVTVTFFGFGGGGGGETAQYQI
jgi:hypothetical protein